jgi:hypothetical protein
MSTLLLGLTVLDSMKRVLFFHQQSGLAGADSSEVEAGRASREG